MHSRPTFQWTLIDEKQNQYFMTIHSFLYFTWKLMIIASSNQNNFKKFLPLAEVQDYSIKFLPKYVTIILCQLWWFQLDSLSNFIKCILTIFPDSSNKLRLDKHRSKRQIEVRVFLPSSAPWHISSSGNGGHC